MSSRRLFAVGLLLVTALWHSLLSAEPISLSANYRDTALGAHASYLVEQARPLTLAEAQAAHAAGRFVPGKSSILNFGMGSRPVWVLLSVQNPFDIQLARRLLIETPWLDALQIYFVDASDAVELRELGDDRPFIQRPLRSRFFAVDHDFAAGATEIYIRVATPDPQVLPIFLLTADDAHDRERAQGYSYGFIYGYLAALLAYNIVLFLSLRDKRHILYANFLGTFMLSNIAYTGHGFFWLWPDSPNLQRWIIPVLMMLYCISGLAFAKSFLNTAANLPRTHRVINWGTRLFVLLIPLAVLIGSDQLYLLLLAFAFVVLFALAMLWLGVLSILSGQQFARYFLFASIASTLGTAITIFSVWGFIPFADWKFRAVEIGMLIDATLLALALGYQFRAIQLDSANAERRAARDSLTDLYNRRSFMEMAEAIWDSAQRQRRDLSLIMVDLDHFKSINDLYGHSLGDSALIETAKVLGGAVRNGDIIARWGGEEFLLLLPETSLEAAVALAERLRKAIAEIHLLAGNSEMVLTASIGVASRGRHQHLDSLITEVDRYLYEAKNSGRNRVNSALASETLTAITT